MCTTLIIVNFDERFGMSQMEHTIECVRGMCVLCIHSTPFSMVFTYDESICFTFSITFPNFTTPYSFNVFSHNKKHNVWSFHLFLSHEMVTRLRTIDSIQVYYTIFLYKLCLFRITLRRFICCATNMRWSNCPPVANQPPYGYGTPFKIVSFCVCSSRFDSIVCK